MVVTEEIHGLDQIKMVLHLSQKEQVVVAAVVIVPLLLGVPVDHLVQEGLQTLVMLLLKMAEMAVKQGEMAAAAAAAQAVLLVMVLLVIMVVTVTAAVVVQVVEVLLVQEEQEVIMLVVTVVMVISMAAAAAGQGMEKDLFGI